MSIQLPPPCDNRDPSLAAESNFADTPAPPDSTGFSPPLPRAIPAGVADIADGLRTRLDKPHMVEPEGIPNIPGYEILGELGRGGMGIVYEARHLRLQRVVALKVIRAGSAAGPEEITRFRVETEAVAALAHSGIVQIYDVGEFARQPYCALEFVPGGSLAQQAGGKPQPASAVARLGETIARAVHFAHGHGIIHRDLKPANVLLAADGTPKITDFGLAKRLADEDSNTRTGQVVGTPCYMAPELLAGTVSPSADIYAVGAILYELLTGRPPFYGVTPRETLWLAETADPVSPRRLHPGIPRDLETVTLACLRKDPTRRYSSALALAEDLRRVQAGEPIHARPVGPFERGVKWARRRPTLATLVATSALALIALFGGGLWYNAKLKTAGKELSSALVDVTAERDEANRLRGVADKSNQQAQSNLLSAATFGDRITELVTNDLRAVPGSGRVRGYLLEQLARIHADCQEQAEGNPAVEQLRGRTFQRLGLVYKGLNEFDRAETAARQAVDIFATLHNNEPNDTEFLKDLSHGYHNLAVILYARCTNRSGMIRSDADPKKIAENTECVDAAVRLQRTLIALEPDQPGHRVDLAKHLNNYGQALRSRSRNAEAIRAFEEALAEVGSAIAAAPDRHSFLALLATNYHNLGILYNTMAHRPRAEGDRALSRAMASVLPAAGIIREVLSAAWAAGAEAALQRAVDERRLLANSSTAHRDARPDLARSLTELGFALKANKRWKAAENAFESAVAERRKQVADFPTVPTYQTDLGGALNNLANLLRDTDRAADAVTHLKEAIRYQGAVYRLNPRDSEAHDYLRNHYGALTLTYVILGDHTAAASTAEQLVCVSPTGPSDLYWAARYLARCVALVEGDANLDAAAKQTKRTAYSEQAMSALEKSVANGFKNTPGSISKQPGLPLDHKDLDPIRSLPAFKKVLADLESKLAAKKG